MIGIGLASQFLGLEIRQTSESVATDMDNHN